MTNLEIQTLEAVKSASREITNYFKYNEHIWEQRRYEIAKDILANLIVTEYYGDKEENQVEASVRLADLLIAELKKQ